MARQAMIQIEGRYKAQQPFVRRLKKVILKKAKHADNHDKASHGDSQPALWIDQVNTATHHCQTYNQQHIAGRTQRLKLPERRVVGDEFDK